MTRLDQTTAYCFFKEFNGSITTFSLQYSLIVDLLLAPDPSVECVREFDK